MPGFFMGTKNTECELWNEYPDRCLVQELVVKGNTVKRNTLKKFLMDKAFSQTDKYVIISDGYLLNKNALFQKYEKTSMEDLIVATYEKNGDAFFSEFRGGFSGALYVKAEKKWLVWTNQTGDAPLFYANNAGYFCAGSQVNYILDALKEKRVPMHFDESAAYQMLTFAFMETDATYAKEIKRLHGGSYIIYQDGKFEIKRYHRFEKHPERIEGKSDEEIVELIEKLFSHAVRLEYEKDKEYGYKHLADLSGGLDSRMNVWVAEELGYHPIQTITYCKANYADELIAKQITAYWKDPLLVKPLEDLHFISDTDAMVRMLNGLSLYMGITGGKDMLETLNMEQYGLEHTGMIGDVVLGSFYSKPTDAISHRPSGKYSEKLSSRLNEQYKEIRTDYQDHELYLIYTRGLHGAANTYLLRQNYTEAVSPFMDVDFLQLCMDIPPEKRIGHALYTKWILQKHPEAAQFEWEKTGLKVGAPSIIVKLKRLITKGPKKLARMMHLRIFDSENVGMNPIDYWLYKDAHLQKWLMEKFEEDMKKMPKSASPQLISDMTSLFVKGTAVEKSMAMTVANACAYYFSGVANE